MKTVVATDLILQVRGMTAFSYQRRTTVEYNHIDINVYFLKRWTVSLLWLRFPSAIIAENNANRTNWTEYRLLSRKGEGTFSEVLKAQHKNGQYVAIKCMKNTFDSQQQVNNLREVQALRRLNPHANIIQLLEVLLYVFTA